MGTILTRIGLSRNHYRVSPGLYGVGHPDSKSPVLVTANYKLSFDSLRFALDTMDAWILVADTRGINVWCAAGKGSFSSEEIIFSVTQAKMDQVVDHHSLILPQLGATGVSGHAVKKGCGFKVLFGPVQSRDLPLFLQKDNRADEAMRSVTFTIRERLVLIPVELFLLLRPLLFFCLAAFLLSGCGPAIFSLSASWQRGLFLMYATLLGICSGSVLVPLLLPWLPGRQFWIKGLLPGLLSGMAFSTMSMVQLGGYATIALLLWIIALSSYQAMNFTGCTPYTSPTGVEYEMRKGIPVQALTAAMGLVFWMIAPFIG